MRWSERRSLGAKEAQPWGKSGPQQAYSDVAIQACLTIKALFGLPLSRPSAQSASRSAMRDLVSFRCSCANDGFGLPRLPLRAVTIKGPNIDPT
ncbi:transposase [Loktanella sp. D2R18]|uniref:transposase n=1 Tax=Yoonia sp. 1_MG-2023 TaxID=3062659 RepID=UPI0015F0F138